MYSRDDLVLFFALLESEFERGISNQKMKYHLAASRLPSKAVQEVRRPLVSAPKEKPFIKLRDKLI